MQKLVRFFLLICSYFLFGTALATGEAPDSTLRIIIQNKSHLLTRSDLLSHPALTQVTINNDRAYPKKTIHHQVIPLCKLLAPFNIHKQDTIELIAKDDFHVYVPAFKIMDCSQKASTAMLAIEPETKWPIIDNHTGTNAGPYEIIWLHPERSHISNEYWAWSVTTIKITQQIDHKNILAPPITKNAAILNGYQRYISHCEGCHALNHKGKGSIGIDLNCPKNPLDYYPQMSQLKKFIRDPQSVRILPQGRMSGSDHDSLSESDLNDLIKFFAYMKTKKQC